MTLREAVEALMAREVLELPPVYDRRGMFAPTADPAPPRSSDAAPRTPDIGD